MMLRSTVKWATEEQWFETVRKLSPPLVVVASEVPPPRNVTQLLPDATLADSDWPLRHDRTRDRVSPGFISPLKEVEYEPFANLSLDVGG